MFSVDEPTAEAIRRAYDEGGELSGIVEFRRHFPLIADHAKAGECVRIIAGWKGAARAEAPGTEVAPRSARELKPYQECEAAPNACSGGAAPGRPRQQKAPPSLTGPPS